MQERQYLITEAQLKALIAQVTMSTLHISIEELIFEDQATLDVFFHDDPEPKELESMYSFPQGMLMTHDESEE